MVFCLKNQTPSNQILEWIQVTMMQGITHISLIVRNYDEAISFYTNILDFELLEDTYQPEQDKRWVVVSPPNSTGATLLLAQASDPDQ